MELYKAIHTILNHYGKDLIAEERLISFLSDYHAFDIRATRRVMHTFLQLGYGRQVLELDRQNASDKLLKINNISLQLIQEGFHQKHVNYVLDSICYGLGWQGELPEDLNENEDEKETIDKRYVTVSNVSFAMVSVTGGIFDLGATPEQGLYAAFDEKPSIQVSVSSFYLAEAPVTQALWTEVMGDNPSHFKGDILPVERVSWEDCQEFIKRLNIQTGMKFRLPTEAEWEYAARGGQYSKHLKYAGANDNTKSDYMWFKENSQSQSHEVKTKLPNELGLFDMSGNISEWCSDWYFNSYANNGERVNPKGPASGVAKVYRGGSWDDKPMNCRVSKRFSMNPIFKNKLVGLRLAATNI
jgi:formylglycine-generating enzyme required for sulfatase activity